MGGDSHDVSYYFKCKIGGALAYGLIHTALVPSTSWSARNNSTLLSARAGATASPKSSSMDSLQSDGPLPSSDTPHMGSANSASMRSSRMFTRKWSERKTLKSTYRSNGSLPQYPLDSSPTCSSARGKPPNSRSSSLVPAKNSPLSSGFLTQFKAQEGAKGFYSGIGPLWGT